MNPTAELEVIERATLTELVRRSLRSNTLEVRDWSCQAIHGGGGGSTGGVYRLAGTALDQGKPVPWSLILKVVAAPAIAGAPSNWDFWKREVFAYSSGILDNLPGALTAPRCIGITDHQPEITWLWLEDICSAHGLRWPLTQYEVSARHLGQLNGGYLAGRPLPLNPWLSNRWLRGYLEAAAPAIAQFPAVLEHGLIRRLYQDSGADRVLKFWADRAKLLDVLDRLPQTFCHLDALRRNLFMRRDGHDRDETVAIDWAFVGTGPVGQELAALIVGSVLLYEAELDELTDLEETALAGYLQGLHDAGWRGEERLVWLGYTISAALRYSTYGFMRMGILLDERQHAWAERALGHPITDFIDRMAAVRECALTRMDEAQKLIRFFSLEA
jgi:hypothetical protein